MKERLFLSVIAAIAISMLFSCTLEEEVFTANPSPTIPSDKKEVKFSSNISRLEPTSTIPSRISGNRWVPGDAIGTFMLGKDNFAVVDGKRNVKYVTKSSGNSGNFFAENNAIYFPEDGRKVRFMSYYPYNKSISGTIYNVDVFKQIPQSDIDLLYCFDTSSAYNKDIETQKVPMAFKHQLAKVYINVKDGDGLQGYHLMNMKVTLSGLNTKADFNLLSGEFDNYSAITPISPSVLIAGGGNVYSSEAIVIPTRKISDAVIIFKLNNEKGEVYTYKIDNTFEKGKKYTYNVVINSTWIDVSMTTHNWFNLYMD